MFKGMLSTALGVLAVTVMTFANAQQTLVEMPVNVDGTQAMIRMQEGQTPEMAAAQFARAAQLGGPEDGNEFKNLVNQLANALQQRIVERNQRAPARAVGLTVPITIDGQAVELKVYEGQSGRDAVLSFFQEYNIPENMQEEFGNQVLQIVNQRIQATMQAQQTQEPMFFLTVNVDGREMRLNHYQGQNPVVEARDFCLAIGINTDDALQQAVPPLAQRIQNVLDARKTREALFELPVTIDGGNYRMVHYEGLTALGSVLNFLQTHGVTENSVAERYIPHLVPLIESGMKEYNRRMAPQPVFTLPLTIAGNAVELPYYAGNSVDETAIAFTQRIGLKRDHPEFINTATQIAQLLQARINELAEAQKQQDTPAQPEPLFVIPVDVDGEVMRMPYFEGESPVQRAAFFCQEAYRGKLENVSTEERQSKIQDCTASLRDTVSGLLEDANKQQPQEQSTEQARETQPQPSQTDEKLSVTVNVTVGEQQIPLTLTEGQNIATVAADFCIEHGLDAQFASSLATTLSEKVATM